MRGNLVVVGILFLLAGCAKPEERPRVIWPLPPDQPRLEWIGNYSGKGSLPKDAKTRALEAVAGVAGDPTQLEGPFGIASNGEGIVYVSDQFQKRIWVYDFSAKTVNLFAKGPIFSMPLALDVDRAGNLYVCDAAAQRIFVFNPARKLVSSIGSPDELVWPAFFALNEDLGVIYISDIRAHRIVMYRLSGEYLGSFGRRGAGKGEFNLPQGVAVRSTGEVFVADSLNARVQVFTSDGEFVRSFGSRGDQPYQFEFPKSIDFDGSGNLWITDSRRPKIYTYSPEGQLLLETGSHSRSLDPVGFGMPIMVNVDKNDRIFISDLTNRRFSVYQYLTEEYLRLNPLTQKDQAFLRGLTGNSEE